MEIETALAPGAHAFWETHVDSEIPAGHPAPRLYDTMTIGGDAASANVGAQLILSGRKTTTSALGIVGGLAVLAFAVRASAPLLVSRFGLELDLGPVDARELALIGVIFAAGLTAALVPAIRVYRMTLADGLSIRL